MRLKTIFFLYFFIKSSICKYLIYPFIQNTYDNLEEPSDIYSYLLSLEYYTNITIAEPPQTIKSYIDFTKFHFYISNVTSNKEYFLENSNSFNTEYDHDKILYTYSFMYGKFANETLYLDLLETNSTSNQNIVHIKNFTFAMPSEHTIKNRKMFPSSIGLGFYAHNSNPTYNFLTQLKLKSVLNNTYFFFNFDDEFRGKLFLGVMPHDIYPKKYTEDKLYKVYNNIDNVLDEWSFRGELIYNKNENNMDSSINKKNMKMVLDLNLNGLIMDISFFEKFNQTFFHEYLTIGICKIDKDEYYYIYCEKDKININNFKTIYFYQIDFNFTFSFDYKDLFIIKGNYIFFNIFFDINGFTHLLKAGKILLKKYLMAFDYEQKMIGFYLLHPDKKGLIIEDKNNYSLISLKIIFIFAGVLFISILIIFTKYYCTDIKRKPRKNEIDEKYDYCIQNNEE